MATTPAPTRAARAARGDSSLRRYGIASTRRPAAIPSRPLRESVVSSTIARKREHEGERYPQPVSSLEPQVDGEQDEQRHDQHDAQVIRVERERVRPVHVLAADGAVDVDPATLVRADGAEHRLVEVSAGVSATASWSSP